MKNNITVYLLLFIFMLSCNDDNNPSPNNNNNSGGGGSGGNNSGCSGGPNTVTDIDGNTYNVVSIGSQCWMKENLKVSRYRNGNPIPTGLNNTLWSQTTSGAYAVYDNDSANNVIYGKLYNWYAVTDPRGLCPTGWHVPSESEWNVLIKTLDQQADTTIIFNNISQNAGGLMKSTGTLPSGTGLWLDPNLGATNSSGFTGLPGGGRDDRGYYYGIGEDGSWYTSTPVNPNSASVRFLKWYNAGIHRDFGDPTYGNSIRCVRD